ncbi:MAG: tetratricopeptide repeat protein [Bacteriovoracaceae bacterium]
MCEFKLTGSDVSEFLDAQTTFNIQHLPSGDFHLTTFLDPQGKIETYGWLLHDNKTYFFLVPLSLKERSLTRLNKFLVSEDVEIEDRAEQKWTFILHSKAAGFSGKIFDEECVLSRSPVAGIPEVQESVREIWRKLNGWPSFDGEDFSAELINNSRLFDTALSMNKGCYPGQETVSKIATRRGAAYSPVLLETDHKLSTGDLLISGNKIGTVGESLEWNGKIFMQANLLRDFRVEGMKITFDGGQGVVRYYPLLKGGSADKAHELYDEGLDCFRRDDLKEAERKLRLALEMDPKLADAYEALGVMLGRQNRYPEAIDLMEKLLLVDPDSSMAHTNLSLFLMKTGKIEEAENHKSMATLKTFKRFGDEAKAKEASEKKAREEAEEFARRERMFREVLEIDPDDTLANYGLGSIAVERSLWETARSHLEKVIQDDPKYSVAYLALGKAYKGLGLKDLARDTFDKGIKVAAAKGDFMPANQMQSELERL